MIKKEEALRIPITSVAELCIPGFGMHNGKLTGPCCFHEDKKLGNLHVYTKANKLYCFTCHTTFTTVGVVEHYLNLSFKESLAWLAENFPGYFSNDTEEPVYQDNIRVAEYSYIGIKNNISFGRKILNIRELKEKYPLYYKNLVRTALENKRKAIDKDFNALPEARQKYRLKEYTESIGILDKIEKKLG